MNATEEKETSSAADPVRPISKGLLGRLVLKHRVGNESYAAWYLLPTIRFGLWDHWEYTNKNHGGFIAFTWFKFDACLMWTVLPPNTDL